jgi:hypothetical protein
MSARKYLECLKTLCSTSGVLPRSFTLDEEPEGMENVPFARGGFSEAYKATYGGQTIVVKALRIDAAGDGSRARTVWILFIGQI